MMKNGDTSLQRTEHISSRDLTYRHQIFLLLPVNYDFQLVGCSVLSIVDATIYYMLGTYNFTIYDGSLPHESP